MEIIRSDEIPVLANQGVPSHQLLFPENSSSSRVTITRVVLQPGATSPRHRHAASEQVWVALRAAPVPPLLADDATMPFAEGDVVRFEEGDIHGLLNTGVTEFEYLAVTAHAHSRGVRSADGIADPAVTQRAIRAPRRFPVPHPALRRDGRLSHGRASRIGCPRQGWAWIRSPS